MKKQQKKRKPRWNANGLLYSEAKRGTVGVRRTQWGGGRGRVAGAATPVLVLVQPQGPNKNRAVSESLRLCVDPQTK